MKLHLTVYRETIWHFESKESHAKFCVISHLLPVYLLGLWAPIGLSILCDPWLRPCLNLLIRPISNRSACGRRLSAVTQAFKIYIFYIHKSMWFLAAVWLPVYLRRDADTHGSHKNTSFSSHCDRRRLSRSLTLSGLLRGSHRRCNNCRRFLRLLWIPVWAPQCADNGELRRHILERSRQSKRVSLTRIIIRPSWLTYKRKNQNNRNIILTYCFVRTWFLAPSEGHTVFLDRGWWGKTCWG